MFNKLACMKSNLALVGSVFDSIRQEIVKYLVNILPVCHNICLFESITFFQLYIPVLHQAGKIGCRLVE